MLFHIYHLPLLNSRSEMRWNQSRLKLLGIRSSGLKTFQCDIPYGFSVLCLLSANRFSFCLSMSNALALLILSAALVWHLLLSLAVISRKKRDKNLHCRRISVSILTITDYELSLCICESLLAGVSTDSWAALDLCRRNHCAILSIRSAVASLYQIQGAVCCWD